jgi:hypothetical protein
MKTAADLKPDDRIEVHCRQCHHVTPIDHMKLKRNSPSTTIERIKSQARCEACGSCEHRFPGSTDVRVVVG